VAKFQGMFFLLAYLETKFHSRPSFNILEPPQL
jgi:hypothetical protein